jgi:hypothetical protein
MEPTNKSNPINSMLASVFGVDRVKTITEGYCVSCDTTGIVATSFRDDISKKEYSISGMCQSCQDDIFGVSDDEPLDGDWPDDGPDDEPDDPYSDVEADADTLASAGMGTDEDYGYSGDLDHF